MVMDAQLTDIQMSKNKSRQQLKGVGSEESLTASRGEKTSGEKSRSSDPHHHPLSSSLRYMRRLREASFLLVCLILEGKPRPPLLCPPKKNIIHQRRRLGSQSLFFPVAIFLTRSPNSLKNSHDKGKSGWGS